jgi:hypothetical protein
MGISFSIYAHSFKNATRASNEALIYKVSTNNQDEETVFLLVNYTKINYLEISYHVMPSTAGSVDNSKL